MVTLRRGCVVFLAVTAAAASVVANPVSPTQYPALSEIQVTDSGWFVEVNTHYLSADSLGANCPYSPMLACTTSKILLSHSGGLAGCSGCTEWPTCSTTVVVNDSGYAVLSAATTRPSRETGQTFYIDTASDTVAITAPAQWGGGYATWKATVRHLSPGQSLSARALTWCYFATPTIEWTRDNSPTMGGGNDLDGAIGVIEGTVRDKDGAAVAGMYVHWRSFPGMYSINCWSARTDSAGHYVLTLSTQEDLVLRVIDSAMHRISVDSVPGLRIVPDSTQHVDITLHDYPPAAGVRAAHADRQSGGLRWVPGARDGRRVVFASDLASSTDFAVTLLALRGSVVRSLSVVNAGPGTYTVDCGDQTPAGTYLCRVTCNRVAVERLVTVRGRRQ